ncbi:NgoFVII family restriction endonuclease [Sulfurospirillum arcachonense]|uniref:NgoFVII family restriction endonuclease n=1 Tax=Sulfurospirillum arcachonense TaxID=57666 RepID=UPI000469AAFB|nr:NgoFVII family restriction endonuclease [Sulfurospirillum arcachonense]
MFFKSQLLKDQEEYKNNLQLIGSLSNLFSDSLTPYLYYRIAEKIFCKSFNADDLSRSDVAIDAKKKKLGIGLKTFLIGNKKSFQKVAEFNSDKNIYENLEYKKLIYKIAELRNARIEFSQNLFSLDNSIYHCIVRDNGLFKVYEENMSLVDIENIKNIKQNKSSITFNDGKYDYSFLLSKSTLTKRFCTSDFLFEFPIKILENPLENLKQCFESKQLLFSSETRVKETIYLPLHGKDKTVFERSGLNQWNAKGRKRDYNEVYIPVPSIIYTINSNFFPDRNTSFNLKLPNSKIMKSKICQDGGKALMSYSNKELGKWILRDVLKLKEGELLTYDKLQVIDIDSVRIDKIDDENFEINFSSLGSYDEFISSFK